MSERDDGGPAFPTIINVADEAGHLHRVVTGGMSLRDYFAAKAMQCLMADAIAKVPLGAKTDGVDVAEVAYEMADAMLEQRNL